MLDNCALKKQLCLQLPKKSIYLIYINLDSLVTGPRASPMAQLVGLQFMGLQRVGHD